MRKYYCDKCKKLKTPEKIYYVTLNDGLYNESEIQLELCQPCRNNFMSAFKAFLKKFKEKK